ncbi:HAD family hydrolase [Cryobacterium sp. TMS1-20-1]|uniref:HAD-IIIC family phosphatase n=1 Tax=Cryobacterium sp. TMS1-20-1 TaxID=1259223 RepID=UPI00141A74D6|nr:HAD-IIIC family phosphatase [Cryobacterium sp. TMS1-20-1]
MIVNKTRIAILSNVNLDLVSGSLIKQAQMFPSEGYNQWVQQSFRLSPRLLEFCPEVLALVLDGNDLVASANSFEDADAILAEAASHVERLLSSNNSMSILVSNMDFRPVRIGPRDENEFESALTARWDALLGAVLSRHSHAHLFDLRSLITAHGRMTFYSDKMWYLGSLPYSIKATNVIGDSLLASIVKLRAIRKKVLLLDLDNTIWGGALGEEGVSGINLGLSGTGAVYRDAQIRILEIANTGILLAAISKNDIADVVEAFDTHPDMVLGKRDFVALLANWEDKAANIKRLAEKLNLGLESFVFLDDNPVERENIRRSLPEVSVVDFPSDVSKLPTLIQDIYSEHFFASRLTAEDTQKRVQYAEDSNRIAARNSASSIDDYLSSLEIKVKIDEMSVGSIDRIAQLTQKTNQFNVLTARYAPESLMKYQAQHGNYILGAGVSDRYGDSGLVLVIMLSSDNTEAHIDNFIMSCRVMGRHIEDSVLSAVEGFLRTRGIMRLCGRFVPSQRNVPVADLFDRLSFQLVREDSEGKDYIRDLSQRAAGRKSLHSVSWIQN